MKFKKHFLFYVSLMLWLFWVFDSTFFEISVGATLIYFLITWSERKNVSFAPKDGDDSSVTKLKTDTK